MKPKYQNEPSCVATQSVATEIANRAERLANAAQDVASRANGKLHPVMTSECPRPCEVAKEGGREYPPLFSDLRNSLQAIESALESIEYALSRTEL